MFGKSICDDSLVGQRSPPEWYSMMFCLTVNESILLTRRHAASKPSSTNEKLQAVHSFWLSKPTGCGSLVFSLPFSNVIVSHAIAIVMYAAFLSEPSSLG